MELGPRIIIRFSNGFYITETACWAIIIAAVMIVLALLTTRNLKKYPKGAQAVVELIVEYVYKFVTNTMGKHNIGFAPYIGTLFFFLLFCNAIGLLGQRAPTADMNFTFAMGVLVFFLIQINSVKSKGVKGYLTHFAEPFPFMIPIKIIEEIVFPVSLSFRIFGNILAGVIIVELYMHLMGVISENLHLPIPLFQAVTPLPVNAFFDIFEPFLQAFVFSMLTMSSIARAIVVHSKD
jgi:F-type H+-transporting ATPase subunit a